MDKLLNWNITKEDAEAISRIIDRLDEQPHRRQMLTMDLTACHLNGRPLDLAGLAEARPGDLYHDVYGITRYIDRETGKLTEFFTPRYASE